MSPGREKNMTNNQVDAVSVAVSPRRGPVTPQNPSRRATARVRNPLPAPTVCPHCDGPVMLVQNAVIYGKPYGEWPWSYLCQGSNCGAYVGLHPFTNIPLGTLATGEVRDARRRAKAAFNPLWLSGSMTRRDAYSWLAAALGLPSVDECHLGWFDGTQCERVLEAVNAKTIGVPL